MFMFPFLGHDFKYVIKLSFINIEFQNQII